MNSRLDLSWTSPLALDVQHGYLVQNPRSPRKHHPQMVLNDERVSVLRTLREELAHAHSFFFSVAFVSPSAIALLKQELVEFEGTGEIVTSDYLGFNSPKAFSELLNLRQIGIDVRIHRAGAFHPKGYIFEHADRVTAMIGSANLTGAALVQNHEWNLKVTAGAQSDLHQQFDHLVATQRKESAPLSQAWIDEYARTYMPSTTKSPQPQSPDIDTSNPADDVAAAATAEQGPVRQAEVRHPF